MFHRLLLLSVAVIATSHLAVSADKPNVVWIVSEDNSKHYLKLFDEDGAETPNIAALAEHGLLFTRAFSNAPVCSVARTTLATGSYAPRIGTQFHRKSKLATLPPDLKLFPAYLREAGYYTTNHTKKDYNCVETEGTWDDSSKKASWRNRPTPGTPFFHMETHTESHESSLHFTEATYQNEKTSHDPASVHLQPYFPDTPLFRYTYARYLDRMQVIDDIVGDTVAKLKEDGLLEDTFIFYFGDHGGVLPRGKGYLYESGLHIPLVVRVPEKWKHLVDEKLGTSNKGFVNFIDFGPTVLSLAGIDVPQSMDGKPFLGKDVSLSEVGKRNSTFGYADRMDEKYDMVRSLRVGDWKYIRNFQPYYPDGLQNNYRYKMLAYREWRDLYNAGKLNDVQEQFFQPKPAEMLFDLSTDPHEIKNLADDETHHAKLLEMRQQLAGQLKSMPDLSFIPESVLYDEAMDNPVKYGQENAERIATLQETADLMLLPPAEAEAPLKEALKSTDPLVRYWAATDCAAFGKDAMELVPTAKPLLKDENPLVRVRAAEFLGLVGEIDPRSTLIGVINGTDHPVEQLIAFNAVALFHDNAGTSYPFDAEEFKTVAKGTEAERRIDYLRGEWLVDKPKGKKTQNNKEKK